jgi:hypothetical protein
MKLYTFWAALEDDPSAFWMLTACDEYSYEGDPDARDAEFNEAKDKCKANGWMWREITLVVASEPIEAAFREVEIEAKVDAA